MSCLRKRREKRREKRRQDRISEEIDKQIYLDARARARDSEAIKIVLISKLVVAIALDRQPCSTKCLGDRLADLSCMAPNFWS